MPSTKIIECKKCGRTRQMKARGMCSACYNVTLAEKNHEHCRRCGREKPIWANGYCRRCSTTEWKKAHPPPRLPCERCGRTGKDVHDRPGGQLCTSCHMQWWAEGNAWAILWRAESQTRRNARELERFHRKRALAGRLPKERYVGENTATWQGGRLVYCAVCGKCAGWRRPCQLRQYKRFYCEEHVKQRTVGRKTWQAPTPMRRCVICGEPAEQLPDSVVVKRKHGVRCKRHKRWSIFKEPESWTTSQGLTKCGT